MSIKPQERPITVNTLRRELNLERWDRNGIQVKAENDAGLRFDVTGIFNDRDELVLAIRESAPKE